MGGFAFYRLLVCLKEKHTMKTKQSERRLRIAADSRLHLKRPNRLDPDFSIHGFGSIYLFEPLSKSARAWLDEHCPAGDNHQYLGRNLAVEFRYVDEIVHLAIRDGLKPLVEGRAQ